MQNYKLVCKAPKIIEKKSYSFFMQNNSIRKIGRKELNNYK